MTNYHVQPNCVMMTDHKPLLEWLHDFWGHPSATKAQSRWKKYDTKGPTLQMWKEITQACTACVKEKPRHHRQMQGAFDPQYYAPGKSWQVDLLGPLPGSKIPNKGLVIVDIGTRQLLVIPTRKTTAVKVQECLQFAFAH